MSSRLPLLLPGSAEGCCYYTFYYSARYAKGPLPAGKEPCLVLGHADYHPAVSRVLGHGIVLPGVDPPSSILGGETFLARIYNAYKGMQSPAGANLWNTTLLIGWDEPGGTYDHVPPPAVPGCPAPRPARWLRVGSACSPRPPEDQWVRPLRRRHRRDALAAARPRPLR